MSVENGWQLAQAALLRLQRTCGHAASLCKPARREAEPLGDAAMLSAAHAAVQEQLLTLQVRGTGVPGV